MAGGTLGAGLKHLSDLFGSGSALGLGDGELLRRYATARDEMAFEGLVVRHGPMVAATCLAVLRDPHEAEDAFQATFLVLARKAGSIRATEALGGWLHRVAYRAAVQRSLEATRRRKLEAEAAAMKIPEAARSEVDRDVHAILHEEVERLPAAQRLPVVLCDLEGLTYDQAAGRLHTTVPTLYHRLAMGRKRLRDRLIRRGVTAAVAGAAIQLSLASAKVAVPAGWTHSIVAAATGGPVSTTVAALTTVLIRSTIMTRLVTTSVAVVAAATLASVVIMAVGPAPRVAAVPAPPTSTVQDHPTQADRPRPAAGPGDPVVREAKEEPPKRGALRIARLKHAGDWNLAPRAIPNLMAALREAPLRYNVVLQPKDLNANDPSLIYYPLVYLHGRGAFSLTKDERDALRRHLVPGGGTLCADAHCGDPNSDAACRRFIAQLLPDHELEPIPQDDPIFHLAGGVHLCDCQHNKAAGGGKGHPELEGVWFDDHWAVIYSKFDLGCVLDRRSEIDCKGYTHESAVRILGNIVLYSTLP
jgi:RNA polymerase sigma factor (sigma-70 family)